jgi:OmpA-OmpF porin, OOP family
MAVLAHPVPVCYIGCGFRFALRISISRGEKMLRKCVKWVCILSCLTVSALAQEDIEGSKDHPLFTRMPGYFLGEYTVHDFDRFESPVIEGKDGIWEGKFTDITYNVKEGAKVASMLATERNYENAIKKIGGKILYSNDRSLEAKITRNGAVTYVHVESYNEGTSYTLKIVETKAMQQDVVADATALSVSIAETGKATVYGIYFDTGKSVVKPESNPALDQITQLMKQNGGLSLYVVGHTDNVGALESNLKLSSDRAEAIVKALVGKGVAATRLKAVGVGPYCPVASNKSDDGKAQNRRVELVEQK